ncbi:hypothetical protein FZC84_08290 [Rossellomorea vietnamensis]|uniref:DUF5673 domain-containing protein n=1 Tax=Rossellomorea vietnamensis TaxID=218284 RepID=A0A5D4MCZ2_9BACI|nr:hypothetical protein [Rossellomorea vietnamensis]TYR99809.1 hypothetical protein FZC84_08290 [Rossellomorea vietnamensis]
MVDVFLLLIFIIGIYYILRYRFNLKKAAETSKDALYPKSKEEFSSILLPGEWLEMEPLTKDSKSYKVVKWGTYASMILLILLLGAVLATDWLDSRSFFTVYFFFIIISAIKHRGNFFILPKGIILNARYYPVSEVKHYEIEKIKRWHELYGLDERADNGYKLSFKIRNKVIQPNYVIIENDEQLGKIKGLLEEKGVTGA